MINQNPKVMPASEEKEEKLKEKLEAIRLKEVEEKVQEQARMLHLPYINLTGFPIGTEALSLISYDDALSYQVVCFYLAGRKARLASPNPTNPDLIEFRSKVERLNDLTTELYFVSEHSFNLALNAYATLPKISKIVKGVEIKEEDFVKYEASIKSFRDLNQAIQKTTVTDLITLIIAGAVKSWSSDIHIEAEEFDVKIRFRIDGILIDAATLPKKSWPQVISRLKLISGLKINIIDRPQDGRFTIELTESSYIESFEYAKQTIKKLKDIGLKISIDDFGTGYSSLRYIMDLDVDYIKIDKIFIQNYQYQSQLSLVKVFSQILLMRI